MNKTVFLTGGTSGIGKATIESLKNAGWSVIAPTRRELDLSNLESIESYLSSDNFHAEKITAFIHVAGIWHEKDAALADMPFGSFSPDQICKTINVGLTSVMLLVNRLLSHGQLSHVVGISGTFESGGAGWLPYYTSKRALEDFLVGLAQDQPGLSVYGISPADTATAAYKRFYPEYAESAQTPEVIADFITSLIESKSEYKSGDIIEIRDGKKKLGYHV